MVNKWVKTVGRMAKNRIHRRFHTSIPHQKITTDTSEFKYYEQDEKGKIWWCCNFPYGVAYTLLAAYSKDYRNNIDNHGNTGTARITLTEARWSSQYDHKW